MIRKLLVAAVAAALLVPAGASAHRSAGHGPAAKACRSERAADNAAFQQKYGNERGKRAMRRCIRAHVRQARTVCRNERTADPAAFRAKYGNKKGKRAFRRCVRQHADDPVTS